MLELEDLIGRKAPTEPVVMLGGFSPDSKMFTYLKAKQDDAAVMDLWAFDLSNKKNTCLVDASVLTRGSHELSKEEKARQERLRSFVGGITGYEWSPDGKKLLFPSKGGLYLYDLENGLRPIVDSGVMDGKFSPGGRYISYVSSQNLWALDLKETESLQKPRPLTDWGHENLHVGSAEFVVEEEFQRYNGYFWSPDESYLAFEEYDESPVSLMKRHEIYADHTEIIEQRYPKAGEANVEWRVGMLSLADGKHEYLKLDTKEKYLARAAWNRETLYLFIVNRSQTKLEIYTYHQRSKDLTLIHEETSQHWINIMDRPHFTPGGDLVYLSERSGFAGVYVYSSTGSLRHTLAFPADPVLKICRVFEQEIDLEIAAEQGMSHVVRRYNFVTGRLVCEFTPHGEVSSGISSPDGRWVGLTRTNSLLPQQVEVFQVQTGERTVIHRAEILPEIKQRLSAVEFGSLDAKPFSLNYRLILPQDFDPHKKYPAVIHVYGGPHAQRVNHGWGGWQGFVAQHLASQGFVVFTLDNRGSANRGKDFETAIYHNLGGVETEDQLVGAKYLQSLSFIDSSRIGMYGWSYGGYMTLMCLMKHPDTFKVGSSGAPVTDWKLYDTAYTERYMGTPLENPEGYKMASVFNWIDNLQGSLQLIHGMADDNVLYVNSTMLYSALQAAGKMFEIQAYPGEKHALANPAMRVHCYKSIVRFFKEKL